MCHTKPCEECSGHFRLARLPNNGPIKQNISVWITLPNVQTKGFKPIAPTWHIFHWQATIITRVSFTKQTQALTRIEIFSLTPKSWNFYLDKYCRGKVFDIKDLHCKEFKWRPKKQGKIYFKTFVLSIASECLENSLKISLITRARPSIHLWFDHA